MSAEPVPTLSVGALAVDVRLGEPSVVTVSGEADLDGAASVRRGVEAALARHPHLVFDLGGVTFADSTFLNSLLAARVRAVEAGGGVRLLNVSDSVRRLLELTGAAALFPLVTAAGSDRH